MATTTRKKYYEILGVKKSVSGLVAILLTSFVAAQDSPVSGRVTDRDGHPISQVMVTGIQSLAPGGPKEFRAKTDADGKYHLATVDALLFFRKFGYRPFTYKRGSNELTVDITLPTEDSGWKVPHCTDQQLRQHGRYGDRLLFLVPASAKAKKGAPDTDNWKTFLSFPGDRQEQMIIWSGPLLGGGIGYIPPEEWYRESSAMSERGDYDSGTIDSGGTTPAGRHWRSISWMTDIAWYHDVSHEAAQFFDKVIETACLRIRD